MGSGLFDTVVKEASPITILPNWKGLKKQ